MENDKVYVYREKKWIEERKKWGDEAKAFGTKIDTDFVMDRIEGGRLTTVHDFLFNKYGFEFVRAIKKILNYKK